MSPPIRYVLHCCDGEDDLIASLQAIASDWQVLFEPKTPDKHLGSQKKHGFEQLVDQTVFGRHFGLVIYDEAACARTLSKPYFACMELRKCSDSVVAMTATPLLSRPEVSAQ